jgi:hypothetical protein
MGDAQPGSVRSFVSGLKVSGGVHRVLRLSLGQAAGVA